MPFRLSRKTSSATLAYGGVVVRIALVAAAYFAAGKLGLSLASVNESTTAVWPPAGIAVASLLLFGPAVWPAVTIGAFFVNLTTSGSVAASLAIAAGNTLEAVAAAWMVRRFAGGPRAFERTPDILVFTLAAGVAAAIAATVGTAALVAAGLATQPETPSIWLTWWLGDAVGTVVVAPLVVLWRPPARAHWTAGRFGEALALAAVVVIAAGVIFGDFPAGAPGLPLESVTVPVLLWAAFRFGGWATAVAGATLSAFAIVGTMNGFGPFAGPDQNVSLLMLQCFVGIITVVMLAVAAEVSARRTIELEVRALNQQLEARVLARTEELSRVHARLIEAQQVAHVGSWEWDLGGDSLWWSDEMCRIFGVTGPPPSYDAYALLIHPFDREMTHETVHRATLDGRPFAFDHRIVRPDGAVRTLHAEGRVIVGPDGKATRMVGTGHDVTERAAAEEQRAQLLIEQAGRRDAEKGSRAKDQFLATLSHELRTPLNVAVGWSHLLKNATLPEARTSVAVSTIHRNLQLLSQLVSDIIDVSRITAGAYRLNARPVNLGVVVHAAADLVRVTADARRMGIELRLPDNLAEVTGDERRLQQVIWNLLSNAVKFGRDDGRVTLTVAQDPDSVTIAVEDDGPGIPPDFLPHVFEAFQQADASQTREQGGLGVGLSIAQHLVDLHGGSITAANRPEGGAVFTVRLPVDVATRAMDVPIPQ